MCVEFYLKMLFFFCWRYFILKGFSYNVNDVMVDLVINENKIKIYFKIYKYIG